MFGLLQEIIRIQISKMASKKWSDYSYQICRLLSYLVKFNFYGSFDRIQDLKLPLIAALDRRNVAQTSEKLLNKSGSVSDSKSFEVENNQEAELSEEDRLALKYPTEKKIFDFLESIPAMAGVLSLVIVAVALTIYMVITDYNDYPGTTLYNIGVIITGIFIIEVSIRMFCYQRIKGNLRTFFYKIFNLIDILVCMIDIVFLAMPSSPSKETQDANDTASSSSSSSSPQGGSLVKTLRMIRLIRLVRILRGAKLLHALNQTAEIIIKAFNLPARYSKSSSYEIKTMIEIIKILSLLQKVIEDRNVSIFLSKFYVWEESQETATTPNIFEEIETSCMELSLDTDNINDILIDVIMYNDSNLVQEVLDLVVAHYSTRSKLLQNAKNVQLLVSTKRERQFKLLDQMLQQLESNAETQELWGGLVTEEDLTKSKQTKDILNELLYR